MERKVSGCRITIRHGKLFRLIWQEERIRPHFLLEK
jgi:hypothetical protein